jgi:hypothetical protein
MTEMSFFQWMTLGLGLAGFLITWTGTIVALTRAVTTIKSDTSEKISTETAAITEKMAANKTDLLEKVGTETAAISDKITRLTEHFETDQRSQDNRFGEVALAIRQYVANVEKEMHAIEIWGRDNFVLKSDFTDTARRLEAAIDRMSIDIKTDLRALSSKIDKKEE